MVAAGKYFTHGNENSFDLSVQWLVVKFSSKNIKFREAGNLPFCGDLCAKMTFYFEHSVGNLRQLSVTKLYFLLRFFPTL